MAITGDALLINLRYTFLGQKCQTGQFYTPGGAAFITANADGVGEAWWNNVKDVWRAMVWNNVALFSFDSVLVEEFDGSGGLGEFAIPAEERAGTRSIEVGTGDYLPSYCAVGVRLTVPTRATRPGQKRIPGLLEVDVSQNIVGAEFIGLVEDLIEKYDTTITLGAPVALGTLTPKIVHRDAAGTITAQQDVAGHVINSFVTSQVSRRRGHGS